ncbi:uncharacterized protein J8A68_005465 [[Candida] subhashii]|uniref:Trafficking protein particle complex II-specific subunit 65 IgD3 domain-containing protein n=1 Tax=[Candida] subhashii TaxID=561895 RepID=A0A8J5QF08_9ASCO|nr:uncharacterized protein J8A68_005465 [[Candida] subhashii]KAG7661093.1 hypothetical protein J8A68_005465 [[Candida] subhashii]
MNIQIKLPVTSIDLEGSNVIEQLEASVSREIVFFDESIVGYIIHTSDSEPSPVPKRASLDISILPQDSITHVLNADQRNGFNIANLTIDETVYSYENHHVWKFEVPVTYPKKRLANPRLLVSCTLIGDNHELTTQEDTDEPTLTDYVPCIDRGLNINNSIIEVSKTSQENVLTETENNNDKEHSNLLHATLSVRVSISLVLKLKSTKPAGRNNMLLATLNIECSEELLSFLNHSKEDYYFNVFDLRTDFKSGSIVPLSNEDMGPPMRINCKDSLNLTYKLINNDDLDGSGIHPTKPIRIQLSLQVQKYAQAEYMNVSNTIETEWTPYLDFGLIAPPISNSLKTANTYSQSQSQSGILPNSSMPKSVLIGHSYKGNLLPPAAINRPPLAISNSTPNLPKKQTTRPSPDTIQSQQISVSSAVTVNLSTTANSSLYGLKLTFIGNLSIQLGQVLTWKIQAINNSPNRLNLSLLVQNPINFNPIYTTNETNRENPSTVTLSSRPIEVNHKLSKNVIYPPQQLLPLAESLKHNKNCGVIVLNNDIRIGPVDPNMVFETEIQFMGISKGIFNLDGIKVFDINSGDGLDFGKLIEVFVV